MSAALTLVETLVQPDAKGKFPTPLDGALYMASLGVPQTPLRPRTKIPFLANFPALASTDFAQIREWATQYQGCNFGSVGRVGEFFVFEADTPDVRKRFEATGNSFTSKLIVASRPDNSRGHRWYKHAAGVTNIQQGFTKHGDFSVRAENMQSVSPGSIHPDTGEQYRLLAAGVPEVPSAAEIAFWESERVEKKDGKKETPRNERGLVGHGNVHSFMLNQAGKLRAMGLDEEPIRIALRELVEKNVEPPIDWKKVDAMAKSICGFPEGQNRALAMTQNILTGTSVQVAADLASEASEDADGTFPFGDAIPDFNDGWITGSFRKMVDATCGGTTIPRQYGWHATKAMVCSILTRYQVALEDCESARTYFVVFGETGTGKGLSFRRTQKLVDAVRGQNPFVKIITSIDSQAGIRDAFFDMPLGENTNIPILFFANEVKNIGHKSDAKKNPDILDALVELADETTVTSAKAKRSLKAKACKSRKDSWLLTYVCSQDKEAFATAFPKTKDQGLPDRFVPEFSPRIMAGSLPELNYILGAEGLEEIIKTVQSAKTSGLTLSAEAKATFQDVWSRQETEYQTSPRFRQQFMLEVYLKAIGEGRTTALPSDVLTANEVVERRKPIRQKYLDEQIPNQAGVYTSRLKTVHAQMLKQLRRGIRWETVAVSKRDLADMTQAYKEADLMTFNQAWNSMKTFWTPVGVVAGNGHTYSKFVPTPEEHDMWLPPTGTVLGAER